MLLFVSILCNVHHFKINMQCILIKNNNVTFLHLQVANRVEKVMDTEKKKLRYVK